MGFGYTCGSCGDGGPAAGGIDGSGHSGQDLAGIYDPGVLSIGEALAKQGYYEPSPFGVAPTPPPTPPAPAGEFTIAAVIAGVALLLAFGAR